MTCQEKLDILKVSILVGFSVSSSVSEEIEHARTKKKSRRQSKSRKRKQNITRSERIAPLEESGTYKKKKRRTKRSNAVQEVSETAHSSTYLLTDYLTFISSLKVSFQDIKPVVQYSLIVFSVFLAISLISFDPMDLQQISNSVELHNAGGILGAYLSKTLLRLLGYGAWALVSIGGLQVLSLAGRSIGNLKLYLSLAGVMVSLLSITALIHPETTISGFYPGGLLGFHTQEVLVFYYKNII